MYSNKKLRMFTVVEYSSCKRKKKKRGKKKKERKKERKKEYTAPKQHQ